MQLVAPLVAAVDDRLCNGCLACIRACRYNALLWVHGENSVWVDLWQCTGCGSCEVSCPLGALALETRGNGVH